MTAVEWLIEQINGQSFNKVIIAIPKKVIEQAKQMEKDQIAEAYRIGVEEEDNNIYIKT